MTALPAVTVIVVAYNHGPFVAETLDSISRQTLAPARVIVVDDASSDGTLEAVQAWRDAHGADLDLIRHATNTGLCRGLNEALGTVRTPLYTYISGDDRMLPERLERQVTAWVEDGERAVAVYSDALRIDAHGAPVDPVYSERHAWPPTKDLTGDVFVELLKRDWIPAASVLLSTHAVRRVGGYDERWFFEDWALWLRLAASGRFLAVEEPLVEFRELPTSLGSQRFTDADNGFLAARVGIWTEALGVSPQGDEYLRVALPPLAIRLWRRGAHPGLARAALAGCAGPCDHNLRLRARLISLGMTREPRLMTLASTAVGAIREWRRSG